jgi:hypothetical protein
VKATGGVRIFPCKHEHTHRSTSRTPVSPRDIDPLAPGVFPAAKWEDVGFSAPLNSAVRWLGQCETVMPNNIPRHLGKTNLQVFPIDWANALSAVDSSEITEAGVSDEGTPYCLKNRPGRDSEGRILGQHEFRVLVQSAGIQCLRLPPRSPNLNAIAKRFVRSIKEECLDRLILIGEPRSAKPLAIMSSTIPAKETIRGLRTISFNPSSPR